MFRSLGLFSGIPCPYRTTCTLLNCFFSHDEPVIARTASISEQASSLIQQQSPQHEIKNHNTEHLPKRRKIGHNANEDEVPVVQISMGDQLITRLTRPEQLNPDKGGSKMIETVSNGSAISKRAHVENDGLVDATNAKKIQTVPLKSSLKKQTVPKQNDAEPITNKDNLNKLSKKSTPVANDIKAKVVLKAPATGKPPTNNSKAGVNKIEALNPRTIPNSPATFSVRLQMLTAIHSEYIRLNPSATSVTAKNAIITKALDEEEQIARENTKTYGVMMRNRAFALRKTTIQAYQEELAAAQKAKEEEAEKKRQPVVVDTTLSPEDEIRALNGLVHSFDVLKQYNYMLLPPTDAQIKEVQDGLKSAAGYEECDRCQSRFRVFPGRRQEDGALTSGGTCTYHWGKAFFARKVVGGGDLPKVWECCRADVGTSSGCTTCENHVFVVRAQNRLAALWQFVETPESPDEFDEDNGKLKAVCLDCEMSYTTHGLELVRVTATKYPTYELVLDVLVRPLGEMLDLNTRFSGVTAEQLVNAIPYSPTDEPTTSRLAITESPAAARDILLSLINRSTILIGHALDNDLNTLRMIHPRIVDTAVLFPHRRGPPLRNALKWLVKKHLGRDIQTAGAEGHDSKEDANGAGDLVRWKIGEAVKTKKIDKDGRWLVPPKLTKPVSLTATSTVDDQSNEQKTRVASSTKTVAAKV